MSLSLKITSSSISPVLCDFSKIIIGNIAVLVLDSLWDIWFFPLLPVGRWFSVLNKTEVECLYLPSPVNIPTPPQTRLVQDSILLSDFVFQSHFKKSFLYFWKFLFLVGFNLPGTILKTLCHACNSPWYVSFLLSLVHVLQMSELIRCFSLLWKLYIFKAFQPYWVVYFFWILFIFYTAGSY